MGEYNDPVARNALKSMQRQIDELERKVKRLHGRGGVTLPRLVVHDFDGDQEVPREIPNPYEGMGILGMMASTDSSFAADRADPYYRAEGAWHPWGNLSWAQARVTSSQSITATDSIDWGFFTTNDNDIFTWDNGTDPDKIQITKPGLYICHAAISVTGGDLAKAKSIYQSIGRMSAGISFGNEMQPAIGTGQNASGISQVNASPATVSKSMLYHLGFTVVPTSWGFGDSLRTDPAFLFCVAQRDGVDWATSATTTSWLTIIRLGSNSLFSAGSP